MPRVTKFHLSSDLMTRRIYGKAFFKLLDNPRPHSRSSGSIPIMTGRSGEGFELVTNIQVPCDDGGLSLGQAMLGAIEIDRSNYTSSY